MCSMCPHNHFLIRLTWHSLFLHLPCKIFSPHPSYKCMHKSTFDKNIIPLSDPLFRLAKSILQNTDDANDAVQDLNLKLWERRAELSNVENLSGFIFRSMRNLCLDILRKRREECDTSEEQVYDAPNPHQQTELRDMVKRVQLMIVRLPELQRTIIQMRDVEGMEIAEIAYIAELTENAVSVNLSRARQKIREQILNEQKREEAHLWKK